MVSGSLMVWKSKASPPLPDVDSEADDFRKNRPGAAMTITEALDTTQVPSHYAIRTTRVAGAQQELFAGFSG